MGAPVMAECNIGRSGILVIQHNRPQTVFRKSAAHSVGGICVRIELAVCRFGDIICLNRYVSKIRRCQLQGLLHRLSGGGHDSDSLLHVGAVLVSGTQQGIIGGIDFAIEVLRRLVGVIRGDGGDGGHRVQEGLDLLRHRHDLLEVVPQQLGEDVLDSGDHIDGGLLGSHGGLLRGLSGLLGGLSGLLGSLGGLLGGLGGLLGGLSGLLDRDLGDLGGGGDLHRGRLGLVGQNGQLEHPQAQYQGQHQRQSSPGV